MLWFFLRRRPQTLQCITIYCFSDKSLGNLLSNVFASPKRLQQMFDVNAVADMHQWSIARELHPSAALPTRTPGLAVGGFIGLHGPSAGLCGHCSPVPLCLLGPLALLRAGSPCPLAVQCSSCATVPPSCQGSTAMVLWPVWNRPIPTCPESARQSQEEVTLMGCELQHSSWAVQLPPTALTVRLQPGGRAALLPHRPTAPPPQGFQLVQKPVGPCAPISFPLCLAMLATSPPPLPSFSRPADLPFRLLNNRKLASREKCPGFELAG